MLLLNNRKLFLNQPFEVKENINKIYLIKYNCIYYSQKEFAINKIVYCVEIILEYYLYLFEIRSIINLKNFRDIFFL